MKVLIVLERDDYKFVRAIVEMTEMDYEFFKYANEYFINRSGYDTHKELAVDTIYSALSKRPIDENELSQLSEHENKWRGKFCDSAIDSASDIEDSDSVIDGISDIEDVDKFITCGWNCE